MFILFTVYRSQTFQESLVHSRLPRSLPHQMLWRDRRRQRPNIDVYIDRNGDIGGCRCTAMRCDDEREILFHRNISCVRAAHFDRLRKCDEENGKFRTTKDRMTISKMCLLLSNAGPCQSGRGTVVCFVGGRCIVLHQPQPTQCSIFDLPDEMERTMVHGYFGCCYN